MTEKWSFRNAAEFREIFGTRECGNGNVARRNKILLETLKDKAFHKWLVDSGNLLRLDWCKTTSMASLRNKAISLLCQYQRELTLNLMGYWWQSHDYYTDHHHGLCTDGSCGHIRYVRYDNGKVYKMKAGKMFRHIIDSNEAGKHFPEALKTHLCEWFAETWRAYSASKMPKARLTTDLTFADIYGNGKYDCDDMKSCMNGSGQDSFYDYAVDATPAALVSEEENAILARCVIFNKVTDEETGETLRLAERQYSRGGDESLKRQLILSLIDADLIDGYKAIGADCHNSRAYVSKNDEDWSNRKFSIRCNLEPGDTLSYQDSFKWYFQDEHKAYNFSRHGRNSNLDTTEDSFEGDNYDEWHERYTSADLVTVYYHGREMTCAEDDLDDFEQVECGWDWEYHYYEDVRSCPHCDKDCLCYDGYYSELTGENYCCEECRDEAEEEYKENNWRYSEYDNEYFEDEEDVVDCMQWLSYYQRYSMFTISVESLRSLIDSGEAIEYEGEYYIGFDAETRLPLDVLK